jgi:hypothetical protein
MLPIAYRMPTPLGGPPPAGHPAPGAPQGPQFLLPPQYQAVIGVNGAESYPPLTAPPPTYNPPVPYNHDFRSTSGARAPQLVFPAQPNNGGSEGSTQSRWCEVMRVGTHVELNYSAAFVTIEATFRVPSDATREQLAATTFQLPQNNNCALTNCEFLCGAPEADQRQWIVHEVSCLAKTDAQALAEKNPLPPNGSQRPLIDDDPACFKMVVPGVAPGNHVVVKVTYYETVECFGGTYELRLPLGFSEAHMPLAELSQRCVVTFAVNAGLRNFEANGYTFPSNRGYDLRGWSTSHQLWASQESPTRMKGMVVSTVAWPVVSLPAGDRPHAADVVLCYTTATDSVMAHVVTDSAPPGASDARSSFAMFLCPPTIVPNELNVYRRVIFAIDKSYSMQGTALAAVKNAVKGGITMLRPDDFFAVVAFSGAEQIVVFPTMNEQGMAAGSAPYSRTGFLPATAENVGMACGSERGAGWIDSVACDGGTDILAVMQTCKGIFEATRAEAIQHGLLDTCFLMTDGAVSNEREVCLYVDKELQDVRMLTFGVGGYVNVAFLRLLARLGRGFYEQSLNEVRNCASTVYRC